MPSITLNGKEVEVKEGETLKELLMRMGIREVGVAVLLNGEVVRREAYQDTRIKEGDSVDVVHAVGGG